jgi:hypothetical protein
MTDRIQMVVGNQIVPLGAVWTHLKNGAPGRAESFAFSVPVSDAAAVFGCLRKKPAGEPWLHFLQAHFCKADSCEVDAWLCLARELAGVKEQRPEWVVRWLRYVSTTESTIVIHGTAQEFSQDLYR